MRRYILAGAAILCCASTPAAALKINFIDNGTVAGTPAEIGFKKAARFWETVITNDATVNIAIAFEDLGPGILGGASSSLYLVPIEVVYGQLAATGTSALDAEAVANLRPLKPGGFAGFGAIDMITPGYVSGNLGIDNTTRVFDTDNSFNNTFIVGSGANLRALGFGINPSAIDVDIAFSTAFDWDFNPSNGVDLNTFDFIGVAIHEIGHGLGFISGADDYDFLGCPSGPLCAAFADYPVNDDWWGYLMDLYRYSNDPNAVGPGGPQLDWAPNSPSYFSTDGGATSRGAYSTGSFHGDGWQASHWKANLTCANFIGIMNPYICDGQASEVTAGDIGAFDAIGWNFRAGVADNPDFLFSTTSFVPEPATWAMLIAGFGMVGATVRRRTRAIA
jgi:hypothetical protein